MFLFNVIWNKEKKREGEEKEEGRGGGERGEGGEREREGDKEEIASGCILFYWLLYILFYIS